MRRLLSATLAVVALLLAAAAPAEAGWKLDRAKAIAMRAWKAWGLAQICPHGIDIRYAIPGPTYADASEWAWENVCIAYLNDFSSVLKEFEPLCSMVLHATGHIVRWRDPITGDPHSSDPKSVMRAGANMLEYHGTTVSATGKRRSVHRWIGTDPRCRERGRPYLERHGLLRPSRAARPAGRSCHGQHRARSARSVWCRRS